MDFERRFEESCGLLESSKITSRKSGCDHMHELLCDKAAINHLHENNNLWNRVLNSIQSALLKDASKKADNSKTIVTPKTAGLFLDYIRIIVKERAPVNVKKIISFIIDSLQNENLKKYYELPFLKSLSSGILCNSTVRSQLLSQDWEDLYTFLKLSLEAELTTETVKCLTLVVKWGPLYTLPVHIFRQEFSFVSKQCRKVTSSSPIRQQEAIFETVYEFCKHAAKDNRMACCKLGEEIFTYLLELYEKITREEKMKLILIEFFLLQVTIHHPQGVRANHSAAYALSWTTWKHCLRSLYYVMVQEIEVSLKSCVRNQWLFVEENNVENLNNNFVLLFVEVCRQVFDKDNLETVTELGEQLHKRQKTSIGVSDLIISIKITKSWVWISLINSLLRIYPDMIVAVDYLELLNTLSTLQRDCKESILRHHLYHAFLILSQIESQLENSEEVEELWRTIADTTLRAIGLDRNDEFIQKLIQILIKNRRIIKPESVLLNYKAGSALALTKFSLSSLEVIFKEYDFLQSDNNSKVAIMKWILNMENFNKNANCFSDSMVAKILVYLILKQWPDNTLPSNPPINKPFEDIESTYLYISFEKLITLNPLKTEENEKLTNVYCADLNLLNILMSEVQEFVENFHQIDKSESALTIAIFLHNFVSFLEKLTEYKLTSDCSLYQLMEEFTVRVLNNINIDAAEKRREKSLEEDLTNVRLLNSLFMENVCINVSKKLRQLVPEELIRSMFVTLAVESKGHDKNQREKLKQNIVKTLVNFSCLPDSQDSLDIQEKALECLVTTEYNCNNNSHYELVVTLLRALKAVNPTYSSKNKITAVFNLFQNLCENCYKCYDSAIEILKLLFDFYPIIFRSKFDDVKVLFVQISYPFYENRQSYGPGVSVLLIKCMRLLYELDPDCKFSRWSNEEVIGKLPEFLTADYQEVRFAAVENIVIFFNLSSKSKTLEQFHRQELMFSKISHMIVQVFELEGNPSEDRIIDETVSRSASVLHTFASIIITANLWIEEALYALFKITSERKIPLQDKVISMIAEYLGYKSDEVFLQKYLPSLFHRWKHCDIETFPFSSFNCANKIQFYVKYWRSLSPAIIKIDGQHLGEIAESLGKPPGEILKESCSVLLAHCIKVEVSGLEKVQNNEIYQLLVKTLSVDTLREVFQSEIDEILLDLIDCVRDENDFRKTFGDVAIFPRSQPICLTVNEFQDCLQYIESTVYDDTTLILHLLLTKPEKIYSILLKLCLNIHNSDAIEEKIRHFHIYAIVCQMCSDHIIDANKMKKFFIRHTIYTLLNLIKKHRNFLELSILSCKLLKIFLGKIVADLATILNKFLLIIVNSLKNVALENETIGIHCLDILRFLLVDNVELFTEEIGKIDTFPASDMFDEIRSTHFRIKYDNKSVTLEEEVRQFLSFCENIDSFDECEHGLKHLTILLSSEKNQLKEMYEKLRQSRGFSEDCENSCLHQLICMLIRLSVVPNKNVSKEAVRCLGEIGPADLATLVLQPEKPLTDQIWKPWELVFGCMLSLLSKYIVDSDINVAKVSSDALFELLKTREGVRVAESKFDFGFGTIDKHVFIPFFSKSINQKTNFTIDGDLFVATIDKDELWRPQENNCHKTWLIKLVCALLNTFKDVGLFSRIIAVCKVKVKFCEKLLPLIMYAIIHMNITPIIKLISQQIDDFFQEHWTITVINKDSVRKTITTNKSSVQCMLSVVDFLRLEKNKSRKHDLLLDYLKVAKAAEFCTAHFTTLLYAELWCQKELFNFNDDYNGSNCTKLDLIYEKVDEVTGTALQAILRKAYKSVGEVDALLGCGSSYLLNEECRMEHLKELGRWEQVIHHYEMELSYGQKNAVWPLMESLKNSNLFQLSLFCSNSLDEPHYESMWRLGQWDYNKSSQDNHENNNNNYDKFKFYAFKALRDKDEFNLEKAIDNLRCCIVRDLCDAKNLESSQNFYHTFTQLQSLKEIEDFSGALNSDNLAEILEKWRQQDDITQNDFQYIEPIKMQRIILLNNVLKNSDNHQLTSNVIDLMLGFIEYARLEGHFYVASRAMKNLRQISVQSNYLKAKLQLEEAQLCWSLDDVMSAKCLLRQLCVNENVNPKLHAMALKLTGKLMVDNSSENRQTIIEDYFEKSLNLFNNVTKNADDEISIVDTYDQLAKFADRQYQQVRSHIQSDLFQKKVENMMKARQAVTNISTGLDWNKASKDLKKAITTRQKSTNIDETEIANIEMEKDNLLQFALKYYLLNIMHSDCHNNITIFRIISLLLENRTNQLIQPIIKTELLKIPTYKFIPILPQIIPHIFSSTNDLFSDIINRVIEKCAKDHPYHTLPLILALAFSNKDRDYVESKAVTNDSRTQNANKLLQNIKRDGRLCDLIKKMEFLSEALIELAYISNSARENYGAKIPKGAKITKIKLYHDVLVPTYHLPVNKNCEYNNIVGIHSLGDTYLNVGGINAPKRIVCKGTDGINRTQLVKGQDDLRQDAVMQQVFTIMNSLFAINKQTKNLRIRTYKIVPLSMRSGVLEWVENSMPIGEYLTGDGRTLGAHEKYRPMDWSPKKCRGDFGAAADKSLEHKLRIFKRCCQHLKPVFHKFFETTFPQATVYYERRRAYIHSVATSSMCGYILGIGDRHVSNILIDKSTAEVIHIDFGIAFEQGRVLPTPETVPFRLSRDVVDGMGVSGVEGVFRKSCEKTMTVLRQHHQTIITILEVLLYDPLYDWTVSTAEAKKRQRYEPDDSILQNTSESDEDASKDVNATAERALLRLKAKLQGTDCGQLSTVEHQVSTLIQQAMDPSNLCRLYRGWQPFL